MVAFSGRTRDGFAWRLAPALVALVLEVDDRHPGRSTASDGSIASAAHSVTNPTSDHEADRTDGFVKALDLTDDPPRFDPDDFCLELIRRRDPRVKYLIFDEQVVRSYRTRSTHPPAWTPEPYRGTNPHMAHAHISVTDRGARDARTWFPQEEDAMTPDQERTLNTILIEQRRLRARVDEIRRAELGERIDIVAEIKSHAAMLRDSLARLIREEHPDD